MLLLRGADTGAKNYEEQTPVTMADDKDLKEVLKELKKGVKKKIKAPERSREVAYSPDLRRKVTNSGGLDRLRPDLLVVRFNNRPLPASPGLLKRRRATEDTEEGGEGSRPRKRRRTDGGEDEQSCERRKRIKWVEKDSTGAPIDPQFSEEEGEASEAANSVERGESVDSSEDVAAYPHGYGHSVSEIADIPGRVAIENHDLLENDNATLADDLVSTERLEWHRSEEGAQVRGQLKRKLWVCLFPTIFSRLNHSLHSFEVRLKLMGKVFVRLTCFTDVTNFITSGTSRLSRLVMTKKSMQRRMCWNFRLNLKKTLQLVKPRVMKMTKVRRMIGTN